jgi:hypothetical protein
MEAGMPWREFEIMNREGQSDNPAGRWPGAGESNGNRAQLSQGDRQPASGAH